MPSYSFSLTFTATTVTFQVKGLTAGQTVRFRVRLESDSSDRTVDKDYVATSTTMTQTFGGLLPKTNYVANIRTIEPDGTLNPYLTGQRFTTKDGQDRPSNWAWYSTVASGSSILLSATEWNAFCSRINEFRTYKELSTYAFTTVSSGDPISAAIVNKARTAINDLPGHGTLPTAAYTGGSITASFFNGLASALNSIP